MILDLDKVSSDTFQKIGAKNDTSVNGLFYLAFFQRVLTGKGRMTSFTVGGYVRKKLDVYLQAMAELGGSKVSFTHDSYNRCTLFVWEDAVVEVNMNTSEYISVQILSMNEEFAIKVRDLVKKDFVTPTKKGSVFAIMRYGSSLSMKSIGFAGTALEKDNYSQDIVDDYNFIIKDLNSSQPSGRIAIFDGPPGTGKTYMVRSLLMDVPDGMFVLVPPAMVSSLGGPELLPMLLDHRQSYGKTGPTIFLLEDADSCLAPRGGDNMDSITSILNIGDGIFGSLFDIRIVATTNAKQKDMDSAVIRAGRLSRRVKVDRLNYSDANRVFKRLLPLKELPRPEESRGFGMKPKNTTDDWSLAEVYKIARDHGWEPPAEPKKLKTTEDPEYDETDIPGPHGTDDEDDDE